MQKQISAACLWLTLLFLSINAAATGASKIDFNELERQVHRGINRERHKAGLKDLKNDAQLAVIARNHSQDMARHHFFNHINLQGEDPTDRSKRQNGPVSKQLDADTLVIGIAENIYWAHRYDQVITTTENSKTSHQFHWLSLTQIADTIVQGWMKSPGHRKNILSPRYDRHGIGIAISGNDVFVTEDLY
jgi:uncharacterized protein YkwD